ncbi:MAG: hypothetical protein NTY55_02790 [Flavobacteriia bacterium]|nr:hypothetical protein [Flavobacteriia bacterium]
MSEIPTAEEFNNDIRYVTYSLDEKLITFAKLHVTAALKEASEKATVTPIDHEEISEGSFRPIWGVDDDSILNSYPLDKIK